MSLMLSNLDFSFFGTLYFDIQSGRKSIGRHLYTLQIIIAGRKCSIIGDSGYTGSRLITNLKVVTICDKYISIICTRELASDRTSGKNHTANYGGDSKCNCYGFSICDAFGGNCRFRSIYGRL